MNCTNSTHFHQHAVWVLALLCISVNEKTALGPPISISALSGCSLWCTLLWMKSQQNTNSSIPEYWHCLQLVSEFSPSPDLACHLCLEQKYRSKHFLFLQCWISWPRFLSSRVSLSFTLLAFFFSSLSELHGVYLSFIKLQMRTKGSFCW